jgi:phosphatidate cytidylyltransferase
VTGVAGDPDGPPAAIDSGARNLARRVVAALVLAPLAVAVAYMGGWLWATLATVAAIGLYVEWLTIVGAAQRATVVAFGITILATAGTCMATDRSEVAAIVVAIGVTVAAAASAGLRAWVSGGLIYAALALLASVLVRRDPADGFAALIFVLLIVWVTDIGGYFAGRGIGGPKLWPRISPKKTWAGAFGGLLGSFGIAAAAVALGFGRPVPLLLLAFGLSVVSQLGDLFESAVKRRFGVKDSSHIIPGHGGLLDRLDGFVAAILVAASIGFLRGGVDGVGRGIMVW